MSGSPVFADTSFFLAAMRVGDPAHRKANAESETNRLIVTTEFIILELGSACARAPHHADFLAIVEAMRASPRFDIVTLDSELLDSGLRRMAERVDKDWSLTDCISFIVMEERRITGALTTDRHFEQAGFQALLR